MRDPNFIIVGTMKSGTSTLSDLLSLNKNIYIPDKEIHFFDNYGGYSELYNRGVDWYRSQFSDAAPNQLIGEKTPTYSYLKDVPERIQGLFPEIKLVWIFRDPVQRAYSNYWHAVVNGVENKSFTYAIANEDIRIKESIWFGYKRRGLYYKQVENYLQYFDIDQMYFMTLKDLKSNPERSLRSICDFLEVDFDLDMLNNKLVSNKTYLPRFKKLRYLMRKYIGYASILSKIERRINLSKKAYPKMKDADLDYLRSYYRDANIELQKITGLDIRHWNQ